MWMAMVHAAVSRYRVDRFTQGATMLIVNSYIRPAICGTPSSFSTESLVPAGDVTNAMASSSSCFEMTERAGPPASRDQPVTAIFSTHDT
jgi:hypothetical protein